MGYLTGGFAPLGYRTTNGANFKLRDEYGLVEDSRRNYQSRTSRNATTSDGTLRIAANFSSPGELLTERICRDHDKPIFDIYVRCQQNSHHKYTTGNEKDRYDWTYDLEFNMMLNSDIIAQFRNWVSHNNISVLNVAGNSEETIKGMFDMSSAVLAYLLDESIAIM